MDCYHPYCPMSHLSHRPHPWNWNNVVSLPEAAIKPLLRPTISAALTPFGPLTTTPMPRPNIPGGKAALDRILELCPCLYTQIQETVSARGIVHLCEITLGTRINSSNVEQAFQIQHPSISTVHFLFPPATPGAGGGAIMEALCSEVLTNHNVPHMQTGPNGWPIWSSISHVTLNGGQFDRIKLYGDILVPAAPHNLLITIKSEAARERLIISGNRLDSIGFGFFNNPSEFWSPDRMKLYKRWGFLAIYMPKNTLTALINYLSSNSFQNIPLTNFAININGKPLYRPLDDFGKDIANIAGKLVMDF